MKFLLDNLQFCQVPTDPTYSHWILSTKGLEIGKYSSLCPPSILTLGLSNGNSLTLGLGLCIGGLCPSAGGSFSTLVAITDVVLLGIPAERDGLGLMVDKT